MIAEIILEGSVGRGRLLRNARSAEESSLAAAWSCAKLVRPARSLNLAGLMADTSCRTPKVAAESCTAGSWKTKFGTTELRTPRMFCVILPRPTPPGTAMFLAIELTREVRSGEMPSGIYQFRPSCALRVQTDLGFRFPEVHLRQHLGYPGTVRGGEGR